MVLGLPASQQRISASGTAFIYGTSRFSALCHAVGERRERAAEK